MLPQPQLQPGQPMHRDRWQRVKRKKTEEEQAEEQ